MKHGLRNHIGLLALAVVVALWAPSLSVAQQRGTDNRREQGSPGERQGYRDGLSYGQHDRQAGKPSRPTDAQIYRDAVNGYNPSMGKRDEYRTDYRRGYVRGYEEGYSGRGSGYGNEGMRRGDRDRDEGRPDIGDRGNRGMGPFAAGSPGERQGYRDGLSYGQHDRQAGKPSRPTDAQIYRDAVNGYNLGMGNRDQYRTDYRRGYVRGYEEGYSGRGFRR